MMVFKISFVIITLCLVHQSVSKPTTENELTEGRGIMSTVWGWITYPFSWWSSGETEQPVPEQLVGPTTAGPNNEGIDIGPASSQHGAVWCNDQTCTTLKCDNAGCRNITCNLYDTDLHGVCREYATVSYPNEKVNNTIVEEHLVTPPVVLSSTVNDQNVIKPSHDDKDETISETRASDELNKNKLLNSAAKEIQSNSASESYYQTPEISKAVSHPNVEIMGSVGQKHPVQSAAVPSSTNNDQNEKQATYNIEHGKTPETKV